MNIGTWLATATAQLEATGIGTARLDALVLLEDVINKDRGRLLAEPEIELLPAQIEKLTNLLNRRASHEPLAYVRGRTEFYGRNFVITPDVLEPRPESETMIELLIKLSQGKINTPSLAKNPLDWHGNLRLADVGSGSGALGITAKLELPNSTADLIDIDEKALLVAKMNVDLFTISINVIKSDLLADSHTDYDILLCNLPYVPDDYQINQAASREPRMAIFGGPDGLDVYRRLFKQLKIRSSKPLLILTEALPPQHVVLQAIASQSGYELLVSEDFIQVFAKC